MKLFKLVEPFFTKKIPDDKFTQEPTAAEIATMNSLFEAVKNGDIAIVKEALKNKKLPWDRLDETNYTLLTQAAFYGKEEIVKLLLDFGFNPAFAPLPKPGINYAYNAFHAACAGGQDHVSAFLLTQYWDQKTIDINMVEPLYGQTALQIAIDHASLSTAMGIIEMPEVMNVNLSHVDKRLRTPLATALGGFVRDNFLRHIHKSKEQMTLLEKICLRLLAENAFDPPQGARPAIQVIFNHELAYNYPSGEFPGNKSWPEKILCRIMLNSPLVCETLHKQALEQQAKEEKMQEKPAISYADNFLKLYAVCERYPEMTKEVSEKLHKTFVQLTSSP